MKIYVAHISHEYSGSCIAALSEAERDRQVAAWCRDFWEKDWRDLPKDDREVIEYYFGQHQEDEQLDEYEVELSVKDAFLLVETFGQAKPEEWRVASYKVFDDEVAARDFLAGHAPFDDEGTIEIMRLL